MDTTIDRRSDAEEPAMPTEHALCADMEQSEREVAAGLTTPLSKVLAELDESIARMETRRAASSV